MNILSIQFLIFLFVLLVIYYLIPGRRQWIVLLVGSFGFYLAGNWKCVFLIIFTIVNTFFAARKLGEINRRIKHDLKGMGKNSLFLLKLNEKPNEGGRVAPDFVRLF